MSAATAGAAPATRGAFGRDARLLTPAEFDRCLRRPALLRTGSFALHLCPVAPVADGAADDAASRRWRLGLVIPKRFEASAVARNTIKRRWRDAFRRGRVAWAGEFGAADLVVKMQSPLIPKAPKPAGKVAGKVAKRTAPVAPALPSPAKVRARSRFDPAAALGALAERLRARGMPPAVADGPRA